MSRQPPPEPPFPPDPPALPHDLEAERSVLGAILAHNDAFEPARFRAGPEHFYRDAHRRLFAAMVRLFDARSAVDFVTLTEELRRAGDLEQVGGPAYLAGLATGIPRTTNVAHYAAIVREKATLRAVIATCNRALSDAYAAEDPAETILQRADLALLAISTGATADRAVELPARVSAIFDRLDYRMAHRGELAGLPTGFASIDGDTLGWQRGEMVVIGARPSMGKTQFAVNTAMAAARAGHRVRFFSLEMRRDALEERMLACLSGVDAMRLRSGVLGQPDYGRIVVGIEAMATLPITIDDRPGVTVSEIRAACRRQRAERGLDLVAVDYAQLVPGSLERKSATRNEEMTDISHRLKTLAEEMQVPVLLLSQLSRALEHRPGQKPGLSDLRDSGSLEQDGDLVAFLHRKNHRDSGTTEFIIAKQRNGPTGTYNLTFDRNTQTFTDGGADVQEDSPAPRARRPAPEPSFFDTEDRA